MIKNTTTLHNVRLMHPSIWKRSDSTGASKFFATFLLAKTNKVDCDILRQKMNIVRTSLNLKVKSDCTCVKHHDNEHYALITSANNPIVKYNAEGQEVFCDDGTFYSGCHVNVTFRLWFLQDARDNQICAELYGIGKCR